MVDLVFASETETAQEKMEEILHTFASTLEARPGTDEKAWWTAGRLSCPPSELTALAMQQLCPGIRKPFSILVKTDDLLHNNTTTLIKTEAYVYVLKRLKLFPGMLTILKLGYREYKFY